MFEKLGRSSPAGRLLEEQLYEQVVQEISQGQKRDGLWAKALSNSDGIEDKAKALYIKYRVQSIKDENELSHALEEARKQRALEEARKQLNVIPHLEHLGRIRECYALLKSKGYKVRSAGSVKRN